MARSADWDAVRRLWRQIDDLHAALLPSYFQPVARARDAWTRMLSAARAAVLVAEPPPGPARADARGRDAAGNAGQEDDGEDGDGAGPPALVGAVSLRLFETPPDPSMVPRRRAHVESLVVDQGHRRAGVGTALMDAAATWARERHADELVLTVWSGNAAAEAFYRRLGYTDLSRVLHRDLR